jgi:hypothetical protein
MEGERRSIRRSARLAEWKQNALKIALRAEADSPELLRVTGIRLQDIGVRRS